MISTQSKEKQQVNIRISTYTFHWHIFLKFIQILISQTEDKLVPRETSI